MPESLKPLLNVSASTVPLEDRSPQDKKEILGWRNLKTRGLTILIVAPIVLFLLSSGLYGAASLGFFAMFTAGIEWCGVKRHLKVSLLLCGDRDTPKEVRQSPKDCYPSTMSASSPNCELLRPAEYALPVPPMTFYNVLKHFAWSCLMLAALYGERMFLMVFVLYFLILVSVTLAAHNKLELKVEQALRASWQLAQRSPSRTVAAKVLREVQWQHFHSIELRVIAEKQPAEQFLDFCLDIFGLMWLCGLVFPVFVYVIPRVGIVWCLSTILGNFANDIWALMVGRTLGALRRMFATAKAEPCDDATDRKGGHCPSGSGIVSEYVLRVLRTGPHPLYTAISPNKSVEGAVAGVIANSITFASSMWVMYAWVEGYPDPTIIAPQYNTFPLWCFIGVVMGVFGVIGDLLQSLLKRSARVKDTGIIIPGHGGMLDRIDGLLLTFPWMYCSVSVLMCLSSWTPATS